MEDDGVTVNLRSGVASSSFEQIHHIWTGAPGQPVNFGLTFDQKNVPVKNFNVNIDSANKRPNNKQTSRTATLTILHGTPQDPRL